MPHLTIGTAGHVDHGKTALTLALTGVDTDRLEEEKRRGLTIESGFAPLLLPDGTTAGVVDVPGHEKFIRNMLSGACGMDLVLLVVAADDGFMPQTLEHLFLCHLLGIEKGIIVLTKTDLADAPRLHQLSQTARRETAGTFLEGAPICPVCARTGDGIEALRAAIAAMAVTVTPRDCSAPFRLAIDRVFSKDGFGTIVTGTAVGGTVAVGDSVEVYPGGAVVRVRALQSHGVPAQTLGAGQRVALNLAGIERAQLHRGDSLAAPGTLTLTSCADGTLSLLPSAAFSVKTGSQLHFYCGTRELLCRCTLKNNGVLRPGETSPVRLHFPQPLAAQGGDKFVVRFLSPAVTVGGGVLHDLAPRRRQPHPPVEDVAARAVAILSAYHRDFPLREGIARRALDGKLCSADATDRLAAQGVLRVRGDRVSLPSFCPKFTPELAALRDKMELYYRRARLAPQRNRQVEAALGGAGSACLQVAERLVNDGVLVPLGSQYRVHRDCLCRARSVLDGLFAAEGAVTLPRFRDASGTSRRFALLLLEYWDKVGVTKKQDDSRILAKFD